MKSRFTFGSVIGSMVGIFIFLRYLLTSLITAAVDYLVFMLLYQNHTLLTSVFIARAVSILINFTLLRNRVFYAKGRISPSFLKYLLLVIGTGIVAVQIIPVFSRYLSINTVIAKALAELMLYFFNYYVIQKFIFADRKRI